MKKKNDKAKAAEAEAEAKAQKHCQLLAGTQVAEPANANA